MPGRPIDDSAPLVSCIMPTRDRPQFIQQAVWYFLRQDYANKQLVVVDDGTRPVEDLLPEDSRIKYVRLGRRASVGEKRNIACETSAGEIIAHFDDDDWMAPERIRRQVEALYESEAAITGFNPLRHFRLETGESFVYRHPRDDRWLAPGTLVYRRSDWAPRRFPDTDAADVAAFIGSFDAGRVHPVDGGDLYVALLHPGNTGARDLRSPGWARASIDEVGRLIQFDREFYVRLRNGSLPTLSRSVRGAGSVTFCGGFVVYEGYGSMTEYAVLGMARAGATIDIVPQNVVRPGLTQDLLKILDGSHPGADSPVLYYSWPQPDLYRFRHARDLFIYTMVESSRVPAAWVRDINHARCVMVPTRFLAGAFRASGVTIPIEVVGQGVDPAVYHLVERPRDRGLTTLIVAAVEERKHVREGVAAWKLAFADDRDARLIIKARFQYRNYEPDDPRIKLVDANETSRGIAHWYREADILMALGNEGFGLPLIEGMATGLPVIALDAEGQSDVCADARGLLLPVAPEGFRPHFEAQRGDFGERAYPSITQVADQLLWVAGHRDEARDIGRAASEWVLGNRNVWSHGPALLDAMERHASTRRPLRRRACLWVASLGRRCGIAEYAGDLQTMLPEAVLGPEPPEPETVRVLHVQHENGIIDDARLAAEVARQHGAGVPLVITEHNVSAPHRVWERDADALIALTSGGAAVLRRKWPGKRVEHIPHGCHEYFPLRKQRRGRVIGTFGFAADYKGLDRLLELQLDIPGSRLLIYSHDHDQAGAGVPADRVDGDKVRVIRDFLPTADIAAALAAEADVLVFWYRPIDSYVASGAVRIALATGVPVMTSPTRWFEELREVTYQPADPVEGVQRLLEDDDLRQRLVAAAREYCHDNSWERIAQRHRELWRSMQIA